MNASQMYNEFEIAYEAIASGDAPGYEPYEASLILTHAQDMVIKKIMNLGIEHDDLKALILGPFIKTEELSGISVSSVYPSTWTIDVNPSDYWGIVNERLRVLSTSSTVEVRPIDHATFNANINNPFKKPDPDHFYWRFIEYGPTGATWLVYNPSSIYRYYINYLDKPEPIIVPGVDINTTIDDVTVYASTVVDGVGCAFADVIHRDIILLGAKLAKAFIGDPQGVQLLSTN